MLRALPHLAILGLVIPSAAFAHGEDVLGTLFAQVVAVIVSIVASVFLLKARGRTWIGVVGCVLGVIVSWTITADLPYNDNQGLITLLHVALPILGTAAAVVAARYLGHGERRA
jgi:4-amino-4-deoxy-L-arabinose transferase-like glycosyltransferase